MRIPLACSLDIVTYYHAAHPPPTVEVSPNSDSRLSRGTAMQLGDAIGPGDPPHPTTTAAAVTTKQSDTAAATSGSVHAHGQQVFVVQPAQEERIIISDLWGTCLSVMFAPDQLPLHCPLAVKWAWSILFGRIGQLFPLIDPKLVVQLH